jgi:hypothetical protein
MFFFSFFLGITKQSPTRLIEPVFIHQKESTDLGRDERYSITITVLYTYVIVSQ